MSEWVNIQDRMPSVGATVLVVMKNGMQATAQVEEVWADGTFFWEPVGILAYGGWSLNSEPTHWMELPEPPK